MIGGALAGLLTVLFALGHSLTAGIVTAAGSAIKDDHKQGGSSGTTWPAPTPRFPGGRHRGEQGLPSGDRQDRAARTRTQQMTADRNRYAST
jgi:hypothetical protein